MTDAPLADSPSPGTTGTPDLTTGRITYIGNATLLIEYAGMTILTDPAFLGKGARIDLGYGVHSQRLTNPAMRVADLPELDGIVLSHMHPDHFDRVAERDLDRSVLIVTVPEAVDDLNQRGFIKTLALETWEFWTCSCHGASITVTALPARHGPAAIDLIMPDVMGTMYEFRPRNSAQPFRLYVSGDTLAVGELDEIPERYPDIDLGILHLGGGKIYAVTVTMDDRQGMEVLEKIAPKHAIPIHFDDYDIFKSPLSDFQEAVKEAGMERKLTYVTHGDTYTFEVGQ